jgi:hypothetical protein
MKKLKEPKCKLPWPLTYKWAVYYGMPNYDVSKDQIETWYGSQYGGNGYVFRTRAEARTVAKRMNDDVRRNPNHWPYHVARYMGPGVKRYKAE